VAIESSSRKSLSRRSKRSSNKVQIPEPTVHEVLPKIISIGTAVSAPPDWVNDHEQLFATLPAVVPYTRCCAASSQYVATGGQAGVVHLTVKTTLAGHEALIRMVVISLPWANSVATSLAWSQSGYFLAIGTDDGKLAVFRVFRQVGKQPVLEKQGDAGESIVQVLFGLAPSTETYYVFTLTASGIHGWYAAKKDLQSSFSHAFGKGLAVQAAALSPNSKLVAIQMQNGDSKLFSLGYSTQKKTWTVEQMTRVAENSEFIWNAVNFGKRTSMLVVAGKNFWKLLRVKGDTIVAVSEYTKKQDTEYSAICFSEVQRCVVVAQGCDIHFFSIPQDHPESPVLVSSIRKASDSKIISLQVNGEEDCVLARGETSARLWNFH